MSLEWLNRKAELEASGHSEVVLAVENAIQHYKDLAKDGWTISEVWDMVTRSIATLSEIANLMLGLTAEQRRGTVLDAAGQLYDDVIAPMDIPGVGPFIERRFVDPIVRRVLLQMAAGAYDALYKINTPTVNARGSMSLDDTMSLRPFGPLDVRPH